MPCIARVLWLRDRPVNVTVLQLTATLLFKKRQDELDAAQMQQEARRLEAEAAAQQARRRHEETEESESAGQKPDDGHDYDDATVGRDESEGAVSMADDAPVDDSDVAAVAMRRKVEREREAAAHAIQQRIRK